MRGFCNGWADRHKDICNSRVAFKTKNIDMEARKFELSLRVELDIVSLFYISESNSFSKLGLVIAFGKNIHLPEARKPNDIYLSLVYDVH